MTEKPQSVGALEKRVRRLGSACDPECEGRCRDCPDDVIRALLARVQELERKIAADASLTENRYRSAKAEILRLEGENERFEREVAELKVALHHAKHGDMDGTTCLLNRCALHYPAGQKP